MKITFWTKDGQAYIEATSIAKEFAKSIRYDLGNGTTVTIKKADIISVEDEQAEAQDDEDAKILKDHPGWICFKGVYDNGNRPAGSCFFDVENLVADMSVYLHYDEQHCEIVRKALLAYADQM